MQPREASQMSKQLGEASAHLQHAARQRCSPPGEREQLVCAELARRIGLYHEVQLELACCCLVDVETGVVRGLRDGGVEGQHGQRGSCAVLVLQCIRAVRVGLEILSNCCHLSCPALYLVFVRGGRHSSHLSCEWALPKLLNCDELQKYVKCVWRNGRRGKALALAGIGHGRRMGAFVVRC